MAANKPVLAVGDWATNSDMIADCVTLGYLHEDWNILDPTYGKGNFYNVFKPKHLVFHDIRLDGVDFRRLPEPDECFDAVVFDPPYVARGGRETGVGFQGINDAYGLVDAPLTPKDVQADLEEGMVECARVLRPSGFLLVKCMNYISSGKLQTPVVGCVQRGRMIGLELVDWLEFVSTPRQQPKFRHGVPSRQVHAQRNNSTLLVFKKKRPKRNGANLENIEVYDS